MQSGFETKWNCPYDKLFVFLGFLGRHLFQNASTSNRFAMSPELLAPLLAFCFSAAATPGPNNLMLTASGATFGFKRTLPHLLGICLGFPAMVVAIGLGLGALFQQVPLLHDTLKVVGAAYLLYLAWRIATAERPGEGRAGGKPLTFLQAAAFQWVNPKAWVMGIGAVSAFSSLELSPLANALMVGAAFFLAAFPSTAIWAGFGTAIGRLLSSRRALKIFNMSLGVLTALSVALIFT